LGRQPGQPRATLGVGGAQFVGQVLQVDADVGAQCPDAVNQLGQAVQALHEQDQFAGLVPLARAAEVLVIQPQIDAQIAQLPFVEEGADPLQQAGQVGRAGGGVVGHGSVG